ncbi:hypothetical protein A21D_01487 [Virgibacillus dokdonensis]|uniref:Uncharacterized protein n=1 Tax=Virgibacillus dokdonensis TaxID=302167 RepID=A0A2K9IXU0_9BACI|nr:hypothetical protein A21D_01487 [Virgibacillus dokdonensis]
MNCMLKGATREKILKKIITEAQHECNTLFNVYTEYREANAEYHLLIVIKK